MWCKKAKCHFFIAGLHNVELDFIPVKDLYTTINTLEYELKKCTVFHFKNISLFWKSMQLKMGQLYLFWICQFFPKPSSKTVNASYSRVS